MYASTNPWTGEVFATYPTATDTELAGVLSDLHDGYRVWRETSVPERAALALRVAAAFEENAEELGALATAEMGKRTAECVSELRTTAAIWRYYGTHGEELLATQDIATPEGRALLEKRPLGVIVGVMPWNYPYYQVSRFAAPNLVLGNTVLIKHSPVCPGSAAAIEQVVQAAGGLPDIYRNVYATDEQVASAIADMRVQGVSLTGSDRAGQAVATVAGRHLKKAVLELGGSDPMIVLDSDDIEATAAMAARARLSNMGQACNSPKRMIVLAPLYDRFLDALIERLAAASPGDPADPGTTVAPLSSRAAAKQVLEQVSAAVHQGARLHLGGVAPEIPGAFVMPTVLTDVVPGMAIHHQEVFGPVAVVYRAQGEEEAVRLANDTPYGLGASVICPDEGRARRVGERLDVGMVFVNRPGDSDAELPFGGVKRSGVGRELGPLGIEEFMNKKLIRL